MRLSGQAKTEFEKWYAIEFEKRSLPYKNGFDVSDDSIKFGVYVDWFDSVGIDIYFQCDETLIIFHNHEPCEIPFKQFDTRHEARTKAIELANQIFNKRKA